MLSHESDEKVKKLPVWAQDYIKRLRYQNEPLLSECATLRRKIEQLENIKRNQGAQIECMVEMFKCAAKGENEVAKAVQRIVEDFLVNDE